MKSNEQFSRKCVSNLPRLKGREFSIVFTAKRVIKLMNIKSSSEEQLTNLFAQIQSFLIDYELIAVPVMGTNGDLFINFDEFHFAAGAYSSTPPRDFLEAVYAKFYTHPVVEDDFPSVRDAKLLDGHSLLRRMGINMREVRRDEGALLTIRRYIPGPRGFNDMYKYHTTGWNGSLLGTDKFTLDDFKGQDVVVVNADLNAQMSGSRMGVDIMFCLPIERFQELCEEFNFEVSEVNVWGGFAIKLKS